MDIIKSMRVITAKALINHGTKNIPASSVQFLVENPEEIEKLHAGLNEHRDAAIYATEVLARERLDLTAAQGREAGLVERERRFAAPYYAGKLIIYQGVTH